MDKFLDYFRPKKEDLEVTTFDYGPFDEGKTRHTPELSQRPTADKGHFEKVEESENVRLWISHEEPKHIETLVKRSTREFGLAIRIKQFDSLHYYNPRPWFQPLVPRQFYVNDTYFHSRNRRLPSWDELFLDLIYVAVIAHAGKLLHKNPLSANAFHYFSITMVPIWLTWFTMDGLNNMYGSASFTYKVFGWIYHTFVIGMGVATPYVFPVTTTSLSKAASVFLMCYFLSQLLVFLFGLTLFMTMPRAARYQSLQSGLSLLSLIPALISYAAPSKIIELWWFSWVLQIIVMKGSTILQQYWYNPMIRPVTDAEHQVERHNLFTIVVMGELFTALMTAAVSNGFDIPDMSIVLGVIVSICFQFIYFTTDQNAMTQCHDIGLARRIGWELLHLPFHICIIVCGKTMENIIENFHKGDKIARETGFYEAVTMDMPVRMAFATSTSLVLIISIAFVVLPKRRPIFPTMLPLSYILGYRALTALVIFITGILVAEPFALLAIVTGLMVVNLAFSVVSLQNVGPLLLRDTACHIRLGLR